MILNRRRRRALLFLLLIFGPLTLLASVVMVYALGGPAVGERAHRLSAFGGLRLLLPQTVNYTDSDGPLYRGQHATSAARPPDELLAVSYNLHFGDALDAARRAFEARDPLPAPDFLLLQEVDAAGTESLAAALNYDYVYFPASVAPDGDDFGNAILSRWPLSDAHKLILPGVHPLSGQQRTATRATARVGGREVLLYSTHIEIATAPVALRAAQMAAIATDVPADATAVLIGGDFNVVTGRGARALARLYADHDLDHASQTAGPTLTRLGVRAPADHLFTRGFEVSSAGAAGDMTASDHLPVWTRVRWR